MNCKYKAVIFDLDGTLLNTLEDLTDSVNVMLERFGYPVRDPEDVRQALGGGAENLARLMLPKGTPEEKVQEYLTAYRPYYKEHSNIKTRPYDGIIALLTELKASGVKLAVVSSKPDESAQSLSALYFSNLMDVTIGDCPGLARKPAPDAIIKAAAQLGVPLSEAVYVGDSEYDVEVAENASMAGIAVSWGFRTRAFLESLRPQYIADTTAELKELLEK